MNIDPLAQPVATGKSFSKMAPCLSGDVGRAHSLHLRKRDLRLEEP